MSQIRSNFINISKPSLLLVLVTMQQTLLRNEYEACLFKPSRARDLITICQNSFHHHIPSDI